MSEVASGLQLVLVTGAAGRVGRLTVPALAGTVSASQTNQVFAAIDIGASGTVDQDINLLKTVPVNGGGNGKGQREARLVDPLRRLRHGPNHRH